MCLIPLGCTCINESSPINETASEGVVSRNALSLTSSTVSPIERTRVALAKETTIKASNSSLTFFLTVQTALGTPGSCETAISLMASPGRKILREERGPWPQSVNI
ncbi:hypothetical protein HanIR_Chr08g0372481 [Helianthus annuus]|nr:hypothetical protein HanIR_Chr08g0372481 [Helianthus annuus]